MSYFSRLNKAYKGALRLPLCTSSKYVIFSDCHRGTGTSNDNFLPNQTLYIAALRHYYNTGYTYIENGDGDELWENRRMESIIEIHSDIFKLLSLFHASNRLYMIFGNHDITKKCKTYTAKYYSSYPHCCSNNPHLCGNPLMPEITFYEGILFPSKNILITHGHQADIFNSTLWWLSRFLVRYLWKPLEHFGILDPTSAAKNYHRKKKTEKRLQRFAKQKKLFIIAGHTHRPYLSQTDLHYCNSGSCVHPYSITCLEIEHMNISLIKWSLDADSNHHLFVNREVLFNLPLQTLS